MAHKSCRFSSKVRIVVALLGCGLSIAFFHFNPTKTSEEYNGRKEQPESVDNCQNGRSSKLCKPKIGALALHNIQKDPKDLTDDEWKQILSPKEYDVTRQGGTEPRFIGEFNRHYEQGTYYCSCCGNPLFSSQTKYDSGSGWPSFYRTLMQNDEESVERIVDHSHGMTREEVRCKKCGAHLGHVFDDGPEDETGERFCINSLSLTFQPQS